MTTPSTQKRRILVVDDSKVNYLLIAAILKRNGFETFYEGDSRKVVATCEALKPEVILMDFEMPELSGPQVCELLKANPAAKDIPIIFVTAHTGEEQLARAFASGCDDYVLKPVRQLELISRVERILMNRDLKAQVTHQFEEQALLNRVLSHDIGNLLMAAQGGLDGIARVCTPLPVFNEAAFEKSFRRVGDALKRIGGLIKNIRDLQAMDTNKVEVKLEAVQLAPLFESCRSMFVTRCQEKKIEIDVQCDPKIAVLAEPQSLYVSVFNNLISNSLKFSQPGSKIEISVTQIEKKVRVAVTDHGIGMGPDLLAKIFSRTEKTSRPGTSNEKGSGFGMPIVKRFVEIYGGTIRVESRSIEQDPQNSGTTFTLEFKSAETSTVKSAA